MSTFERVKQLCAQRHLTLAQVNDRASMGKNSIYSWKTSKPGMENLQKVAKVLHTSTDYLLGNTDEVTELSKDNEHPFIDISDEESIYSYRGEPVPKEYLDIVRNLMDSDIRKRKDR